MELITRTEMKHQDLASSRWLLLFAFTAMSWLSARASDTVVSVKTLGEYLIQHGYGAAAIEVLESGGQFIKAQIDGQDVFLSLNSNFRTSLTDHRARGLRLEIHDTGQKSWGLAAACKDDSGVAIVKSFTISGCTINRMNTIDVLSKGFILSYNDGIFGYDCLHFNAAILPIGGKILFFKPGAGPPLSIESSMRAMGYRPVPMTYGEQGPEIEGRLNGHPFTAQVSSQAGLTVFAAGYLKASGQPVYDSGLILITDRDEKVPVSRFRPSELAIGSVTVDPSEVGACDSPYFAHFGCDAILGKDILSQRAAVIDFGSNILWLK